MGNGCPEHREAHQRAIFRGCFLASPAFRQATARPLSIRSTRRKVLEHPNQPADPDVLWRQVLRGERGDDQGNASIAVA